VSEACVEDGGYAVDAADLVRDGDAAVAVWRASLGNADGRAAKLDWFYLAAPDGALLQVLRHGAMRRVVGTAGVGWRRMQAGGRLLRGGLLADMAVLSDHRMLGPALSLQRAACDRALAEGDLVYGFPNPNAIPVVKRLGYAHAGDMVLHVRPLRHAPYLARRLPGPVAAVLGAALDLATQLRDRWRMRWPSGSARAHWRDALPPDAALPEPGNGSPLQGVRSHAALDWRFRRSPLAHFRYLEVELPGRGVGPAWFVCHRGGDALYVDDIVLPDGASLAQSLATLSTVAHGMGCRSLSVECCLPAHEAEELRRAGFRERQRRPIYVRWKDPAMAGTALRFTAFDEDE
jgi:hypothetical protein